jgi:hypothetical protein
VRTDTLREFLAMQVRFFEKANTMADVPEPPKKAPDMDDDRDVDADEDFDE